jgi:hypothetical protein
LPAWRSSHTKACGATTVLVAPQALTQPKWLFFVI